MFLNGLQFGLGLIAAAIVGFVGWVIVSILWGILCEVHDWAWHKFGTPSAGEREVRRLEMQRRQL